MLGFLRHPNYGLERRGAPRVRGFSCHPDAGDVVPHSGGVRKVRWSRKGLGKRGGVRVIYFNRLDEGEIWLLLIYAKSADDNIPAHVLQELKEELDDD